MSEEKQIETAEIQNEDPYGPIWFNGKYNKTSHQRSIGEMVERDLTIPKFVEDLGEENTQFINVDYGVGGKWIFTYHPNPTGEIPNYMNWISLPALYVKNAGKYYKMIANKRIDWFYKVLNGDMSKFMTDYFEDDIINALYDSDITAFAKKASKFIIDYPHKSMTNFGCYFAGFVTLIRHIDENIKPQKLKFIQVKISACLKYYAEFEDKKLDEDSLYYKIRDISTKMLVQDCSKTVHYQLSLVDLNAKQADNILTELDKEVMEENEREKKAKLEKIESLRIRNNQKTLTNGAILQIEPKKRKLDIPTIEEIENDEPPKKVQKVSTEDDNSIIN